MTIALFLLAAFPLRWFFLRGFRCRRAPLFAFLSEQAVLEIFDPCLQRAHGLLQLRDLVRRMAMLRFPITGSMAQFDELALTYEHLLIEERSRLLRPFQKATRAQLNDVSLK